MDLNTFRSLRAPAGQEALQAAVDLAPREVDFLRHFQTLCRRFPSDLARASLETAILRAEASVKFPFADKMYFTRHALEQASSWEVSTYRARRFQSFEYLVDLGCSVGGDTLALAYVATTIGIDLDPLRLTMAQANLNAVNSKDVNLRERTLFLHADLTNPLPLFPTPLSPPPSSQPLKLALFFDPARRANGRRLFSVRHYRPPLAIVQEWLPRYPALGVKISPGVNLDELEAYDAEIEFISLRGKLKEAVLWFGPLKTARRRATVLPGPHSLIPILGSPLPISEPRAYLYEPDPAILRAGLVATLGAQLVAAQLDVDIAYLTAEKLKPTPFARAWTVEDWFPFGLKRLRAYLRQRNVGRVVVKKRGSPLQPEALIRDLRLKGDQERVVFLTHLRGRPIVVVAFAG